MQNRNQTLQKVSPGRGCPLGIQLANGMGRNKGLQAGPNNALCYYGMTKQIICQQRSNNKNHTKSFDECTHHDDIDVTLPLMKGGLGSRIYIRQSVKPYVLLP